MESLNLKDTISQEQIAKVREAATLIDSLEPRSEENFAQS